MAGLVKRVPKCPSCGGELGQYKAGKPWTCSSCLREWQAARWFEQVIAWGSLALTFLLLLLLEVRSWRLLIGAVVLWFPVLLICIALLESLGISPKEPFGHERDSQKAAREKTRQENDAGHRFLGR